MIKSEKPNLSYQCSDHGAGRRSVQVFDEAGNLVSDCPVVKDVNGWRVVCLRSDGRSSDQPQHATPETAARWWTGMVALEIEGKKLTAEQP